MHSYTAAQVREAETPFLERGVPLMARAAAGLASETAALLDARRAQVPGAGAGAGAPGAGALDDGAPDVAAARDGVRGAEVVVLAGAGNNGGDALYAAALLAERGAVVGIVLTASRVHQAGLEAALGAGARLWPRDETPAAVAARAAAADVILDGILGTGTTGDPVLRGSARAVVTELRRVLPERRVLSGTPRPLVVAVDLPSGIGVDDGSVPDATVLPADLTVTFGGLKSGLVRRPAADYVGRVVLVDIGIGAELERIRRRDLASPQGE